ncbi:hypothetical protein EYF80_036414 [Liparis tanakae]|uniref:Uncharacterized protein n=1 Tax=Liparis tanakae TaxID=230148 RepID=A0A4Z2GIM6_9TELE|nr:hypothetical protein EYF80_036414 [Liparis tanakae]
MSSAEEFKAAGWMLWGYYSAKLEDYGGEYQSAVPGCQVSVDEVLRGQVDHAGRDLLGDVQHLGLGELHQDAVLAV